VRVIRSPSNDVWALGHWLIYSAADVPAGHKLQDSVRLYPLIEGLVPPPATTQAPVVAQAEPFFAVLHEMMQRNPIPPSEAQAVAAWAAWGIRSGVSSPWASVEPALQQTWAQALAAQLVRARRGTSSGGPGGPRGGAPVVSGWQNPAKGIDEFGQDYALRAHIALTGLAALPMQEAVYLQTEKDAQG
jgi:hypothetical protein